MPDEKYVVFKRSEIEAKLVYFRLNPHFKEMLDSLTPVEDAVVIRTQDAFAAAGLSAYAHNIDFAYAVTPSAQLEAVRDYFHSVAQEAEDRLARGECKLPD